MYRRKTMGGYRLRRLFKRILAVFSIVCLAPYVLSEYKECPRPVSRRWEPTSKVASSCVLSCVRNISSMRGIKGVDLTWIICADRVRRYCATRLWRHLYVKALCRSCIYQETSQRYIYHEGRKHHVRIRRNLNRLTDIEVHNILYAFKKFKEDESVNGFKYTVRMHNQPGLCPHPSSRRKKICSIHGDTLFLMFHRLYIYQAEDALRLIVPGITIPYFDWTKPFLELPNILREPRVHDPILHRCIDNPLYSGKFPVPDHLDEDTEISYSIIMEQILHGHTSTYRNIPSKFYRKEVKQFFSKVMQAMEATHGGIEGYLPHFDNQIEVPHDLFHDGINGTFPLTQLSAYDPLFYFHHSFVDKLFAVWQQLMEHRNIPVTLPTCAYKLFYEKPLLPFNFAAPANPNDATRMFSKPVMTMNYVQNFQYDYDDYDINGYGIDEISKDIDRNSIERSKQYFAAICIQYPKKGLKLKLLLCRISKANAPIDCRVTLLSFRPVVKVNSKSRTCSLVYRDITDLLTKLNIKDHRKIFLQVYRISNKHGGNNIPEKYTVAWLVERNGGQSSNIIHIFLDHYHTYPTIPVEVHQDNILSVSHHSTIQYYTLQSFHACDKSLNNDTVSRIKPVKVIHPQVGNIYFASDNAQSCRYGSRLHINIPHVHNLSQHIQKFQKHGKTIVINWGFTASAFKYDSICLEKGHQLLFIWCLPHHDVQEISRAKFLNCDPKYLDPGKPVDHVYHSNSKLFKNLNIGDYYFACTQNTHCLDGGMRILVRVREKC